MAAFIKHIPCETCGSSDARGLYSDDGEYCFSCKSVKPGSEYKDEDSYERPPIRTSARKETMTVEIKSTKPVIDPDDAAEIKEYSTLQGFNFRNIKDETYRQFGVRHAVDENNNVLEQYYPCTQEGQLVGYKIREVPKTFYSKGRTGADCELFMQFRFNRGGKYVMITEGECLLPSAKVLTRKGWVTLEDWNGQEVMQANGKFATPIAKIEKDYEGTMLNYTSGSFVQDLTPKHNMLRINTDGTYFKAAADDIKKKRFNVPRTVNFESDTDNLLARIQVMLSADFTFREKGDIYGCLKKERKITRCKQLLDASGVRYTVNIDGRGYSSFFIHRGHGLNVSKVFDWARDLPSAATIIEEVLFWDGNSVPDRNQIEYSTVISENAEFIQTCAHLCGYVSSIIRRTRDKYSWMKVSILKGKNSSSTQKGYTEYDYTGKVMCLTMPDGTLLIKQGDSISCTGNCDSLSGYQMLKEYYDKKDSGFEVAVVSPTTGANSHKQIAAQYKFFDTFDNIIVCYDNDKAGQEAVEEVIKVLPKGKVKIMNMRMKDANEYLKSGKEAAFISDFFNAKTYTPAGVVGSSALYQRLLDSANVKKVPLPPFMKKLGTMINDIELGTIGVFAAGSGAAKCLAPDTVIMMHDFSKKKVQDIVVGDKVIGPDGKPRNVLSVSSGFDEMYKIDQVKGISYSVNSAHILSLRSGATKRTSKGNLEKGGIYNVNVKDYHDGKIGGTKFLKGYKAEFKDYESYDLDFDLSYILGLWLAEGTSAKAQFTLANKDSQLKDELYKFCEKRGFTVTAPECNKDDNCQGYNVQGGFLKILQEYDLLNNKHIPEVFQKASTETKLHLLAGIIDGDGYLNHGSFVLHMLDNQLSRDIVNVARSVGLQVSDHLKFSKAQTGEGGMYHWISINGYIDKILNRLPRKKAPTRKQIKNPMNTGITVTPVGVGKYFGFTLDGDHLFCLEDGTVTHNTTVANEMIYFWLFNSPHKVGVVSLELTCEQYAQAMLSRHIRQKISLIRDTDEKIDFLKTEKVRSKAEELFQDSNGGDRFMIIDERDGSIEVLQDKIEELVISCGCRIIVLDPLSDLLDGLSTEAQALFMKWCKSIIKSYNVTFIMISHIRKSGNNKDAASTGAFIPEESIMGSSTIFKSASWVVMMMRDKYNEDPIIRNTTQLVLSKNRAGGDTGPAGELFYDNQQHVLHDKEDWELGNSEF